MKSITYKNVKYQLDESYWKGETVNDSLDFQYMQLEYCIETGDFLTLENRLNNMLQWGGVKIIKS